MRLAVYQGAGVPENSAANLTELERASEQAAQDGADLLILPELWLSGYNVGSAVTRLAQDADGPAAQQVGRIAERHRLAVLYGYPERDGSSLFNAARFIDASGAPIANMRKAHLYGVEERRLFSPGDTGFVVVDYCGLRIGILICYDIEFPEAARTLALCGVDLIAVPTALFHPYHFVAMHVVPVRAWENQTFVAYANRCGQEGSLSYVGCSSIYAPDGNSLASAAENMAMITADIEPETYWDRTSIDNTYICDRRVDLYSLVQLQNK